MSVPPFVDAIMLPFMAAMLLFMLAAAVSGAEAAADCCSSGSDRRNADAQNCCRSLQKDLMASISALNHFLEVSAFAPANVIMMAELVVLPHINHDDRAGGAT
eukprot:780606-Rhodomonas_salina.2